ncbi:MAG TPA: phosphotransferase, partial [Thermomicrobiales bacterium]|nr:phosphotransferase [Thermomicrobiales bacterium]
FFPEATSIEPAAGRSHLARVEAPSGVWAVRQWPAGTPRTRLDFVHALLKESRDAGIAFVPEVAARPDDGTVIAIGGSFYDAESWLPGRAPTRGLDLVDDRGRGINRPAPLPATTMTAVVRAVASWHRVTQDMAGRNDVPQAPLDAVLRAVRSTWEEQRRRLRPLAPRTPHIQRWLRSGEVVLAGAVDSLATVDFLRGRPLVIGHLNLWPAHLLVSRVEGHEEISGLIDFADAAASSPLVDLVQLIARFNGWTGSAAEEAIGAYVAERPLAPEERRSLPAVAGLDLVVETGRLLTLGYATPAVVQSGRAETVRNGAAMLLLSLEAVTPAVQRGDRPEPSRARKWDYSTRRGGSTARRGGGPTTPTRSAKPADSRPRSGPPDRRAGKRSPGRSEEGAEERRRGRPDHQ